MLWIKFTDIHPEMSTATGRRPTRRCSRPPMPGSEMLPQSADSLRHLGCTRNAVDRDGGMFLHRPKHEAIQWLELIGEAWRDE
jgi:hypothetical protein